MFYILLTYSLPVLSWPSFSVVWLWRCYWGP